MNTSSVLKLIIQLPVNTKLAIIAAMIGLTLTGCGSSIQEEQFAWLDSWDSKYTEKMVMVNSCLKEAGVKHNGKISKQQNKVFNECELSYITDLAENEGVSLDRELLKNNIIQF